MTVGIILACLLGICVVGGGVMAALLLPAIQQARNAARLTQSKNNMRQIGLALHNYQDLYKEFPAGGTFTEDGQAHHGWATRILPLIEQAPLYNQVDFNKPWTAPEMSGTFRTQVPVFLNPGVTERVSPEGYALSHYAANSQVLGKNKFLKVADIKDGLSNTILAGEASGSFKPWGSPENVRDPAKGFGTAPDQFGPVIPGRVAFLMGDGSVRTISTSIDPNALKALASPEGGEQPPLDF
jgi:type II secretory pathway pseudopilin PulG